MNGPKHYREAERIMERYADLPVGQQVELGPSMFAEAQVHATLAVTAVIADGLLGKLELPELDEWAKAVSS